jgi:hypothetical protein
VELLWLLFTLLQVHLMLLLLHLLMMMVVMLLHLLLLMMLVMVQQLLFLLLLLLLLVHLFMLRLEQLGAKLVNSHDVLAQVGRLDAGVGAVVALVVLLLVVHEAHVLREVGHVFPAFEANFPGQDRVKINSALGH